MVRHKKLPTLPIIYTLTNMDIRCVMLVDNDTCWCSKLLTTVQKHGVPVCKGLVHRQIGHWRPVSGNPPALRRALGVIQIVTIDGFVHALVLAIVTARIIILVHPETVDRFVISARNKCIV